MKTVKEKKLERDARAIRAFALLFASVMSLYSVLYFLTGKCLNPSSEKLGLDTMCRLFGPKIAGLVTAGIAVCILATVLGVKGKARVKEDLKARNKNYYT